MTNGSFGYRAQIEGGGEIVGSINAIDEAAARQTLESLHLRVGEIWASGRALKTRPLNADDFRTFNQQLAMLINAGLPLETGLDLLAAERGGRMRNNLITAIGDDMKSGMTLAQAIAKRGRDFPPDYALLVEAGVRTNNLSQVLINLSNHLATRQKLRESIFKAFGYPAFVLAAMIAVGAFFGWYIFPLYEQFAATWINGRATIWMVLSKHEPWPTELLDFLGRNTTPIFVVICAVVVAGILFWLLAQRRPFGLTLRDWVAEHMPLFGPMVRASLIARWCDGLRIGVISGMDLPRAIELAGAVTGSPKITASGSTMNLALARGEPMDKAVTGTALPPAIGTAIETGIACNNLPETLGVLTEGYTKEAETRIALLPAVITPVLLVVLSLMVVLVFWGLTAPLLKILNAFTS